MTINDKIIQFNFQENICDLLEGSMELSEGQTSVSGQPQATQQLAAGVELEPRTLSFISVDFNHCSQLLFPFKYSILVDLWHSHV